uniref:CSON010875 protein n=1 Tax=Culicoides sonorensis TaxID=179676 RepID=A0A336M6I2_CULSO
MATNKHSKPENIDMSLARLQMFLLCNKSNAVPDDLKEKGFLKNIVKNYLEIKIDHLSSEQQAEIYSSIPDSLSKFREYEPHERNTKVLKKWLFDLLTKKIATMTPPEPLANTEPTDSDNEISDNDDEGADEANVDESKTGKPTANETPKIQKNIKSYFTSSVTSKKSPVKNKKLRRKFKDGITLIIKKQQGTNKNDESKESKSEGIENTSHDKTSPSLVSMAITADTLKEPPVLEHNNVVISPFKTVKGQKRNNKNKLLGPKCSRKRKRRESFEKECSEGITDSDDDHSSKINEFNTVATRIANANTINVKNFKDNKFSKNNALILNGTSANICKYFFELNSKTDMLSFCKGTSEKTISKELFDLQELLNWPGVGIKIDLPGITIKRHCQLNTQRELIKSHQVDIPEEYLKLNKEQVFRHYKSKADKPLSSLNVEVELSHDLIQTYLILIIECLTTTKYVKGSEVEKILETMLNELRMVSRCFIDVTLSYFPNDHQYYSTFKQDVELGCNVELLHQREFYNPEILFTITKSNFHEMAQFDSKSLIDYFEAILTKKDPDAVEEFHTMITKGYEIYCVDCDENGLDSGKFSSAKRVQNISEHISGHYYMNDVHCVKCNFNKSYYPADAYAQSKLAQLMFTRHLEAKLKEIGANVHVYAVHPGVVNTELFDVTGMAAIPWFRAIFFKTPEQGSRTVVYAAIDPKLEGRGGGYFSNCMVFPLNAYVKDQKKCEQLYNISCELLQLKNFKI